MNSQTPKEFLEEHLKYATEFEELFMGGTSKDGTYVLITPKNISIKTLKQMRVMIADHIKEMKEDQALLRLEREATKND